jgi:hypothetical protein
MEDRGDHRVRVLAPALLAALLLVAQPAVADHHEPVDWPLTATVETSPDGVTVEAGVSNTTNGTSGVQTSSSGSNCWLEGPGNIGVVSADLVAESGQLPYTLVCDGEVVGVVWLSPDEGGEPSGPPALSPEEVAMQLREQILVPNVTIGINPDRGLVGVESWFWIEDYDGQPVTESTDAFGRRIEVEARVERYEWSFGDGESMNTESPGRPYPKRSDVRHVYERSSLGYPDGYMVEVGFVFSVRYRVGGGGWIVLPGIERLAETDYPVRESQAVVRQ